MAAIDELLAAAQRRIAPRLDPADLPAALARGALVVDTRPEDQRRRDGELPGAIVVDRNVLEWRLDPTSPHRLPEVTDDAHDREIVIVCNQGYSSSLAAATLRDLGLHRATDLAGGFQAYAARMATGRIVVGVDGSDVAQAALAFALDESRLRGAALDVVLAWHEPYTAASLALIAPDPGVYNDAAVRTLDDVLASADVAGVDVKKHIERGGPAEALLRIAEGADLLVVGSRGHGGFTGLLLGSVSQQVVHHATCPVVVVPLPGKR